MPSNRVYDTEDYLFENNEERNSRAFKRSYRLAYLGRVDRMQFLYIE